jgi:hypothetical protein
MPTVLKPDPFSPVLLSSPPLNVTPEQKDYIKKVLDRACSDSRFSDKAYVAVIAILTGATVRPPTVTSLTPNSAEIGDPSFTLHVHGTNFNASTKIIFNGFEEPTTLVGPTQVTTGVNMPLWLAPVVVPVTVVNNGVQADPMMFSFVDGLAGAVLSGPGGIDKKEPVQQTFKFTDDEKKDEKK